MVRTSPPLANSIPEACKRLGIGKTYFHELLRDGRIRAFKAGRRTLVPESELERFIAEQLKNEPAQAA